MCVVLKRGSCTQRRKPWQCLKGTRDGQTEPCHLESIFCDPCHPAPIYKPVSPNSQAQTGCDLPHVEVAGPRKDLGLVNGLKLDPGRRHG